MKYPTPSARYRVFEQLIILCMAAAGCSAADPHVAAEKKTIAPGDEAEVELTWTRNGTTLKLYRGDIYREDESSGRWHFVATGYDPDYFENNYVRRQGTLFRKDDDGQLYKVMREFSDGFENVRSTGDLIDVERGWTALTLQSPKTPTVKDYVKLRKRILEGRADFLDNRIEPTEALAHGGNTSLRAFSVPRRGDMVTNKASISTELVHFVRGDDVWYSAWYFVPADSGMPLTLMDLETGWFKGHPGIRIRVFGEDHLGVELKWSNKPTYRQAKGKETAFPRGRWVHVLFHVTLSEQDNGVVELWQDGERIVATRGQTLPLKHTIYNILEVGISAHSMGRLPATLYVDDVTLAGHPPR
jgi:hypothetical protein